MADMSNTEAGGGSMTSDEVRAAAQDRRLAKEAAGWRVKFRDKETENTQLRNRIAELEARNGSPSAEGETASSPAADGTRSPESPAAGTAPGAVAGDDAVSPGAVDEFDDLVSMRDDLRIATIHQQLEDAGALLPEEALTLLQARKQLVIDDDTGDAALIVNGKPAAIDAAALGKLLRPELLRAAGVSGTGSHGPRTAPSSGVDMKRIANDPKYYRQHRAEIIARLKGR